MLEKFDDCPWVRDVVLSAQQISFFQSNGYLRVRNVIPRAEAIEFGVQLKNFANEYGDGARYENGRSGALRIFHHPKQWEIRQNIKIYQVFRQLLQSPTLWVSIDRAKVVEPTTNTAKNPSFLHWDIDPVSPPAPLPVQGLVSLSDNNLDEGCFQCIPGYHKKLDSWPEINKHTYDSMISQLDPSTSVQIPIEAGDLLVWSSLLPHGAARNKSKKHRVVQYVRLYDSTKFDEEVLERRLASWHGQTPSGPGIWPRARLSTLGEYLVGLRRWEPI